MVGPRGPWSRRLKQAGTDPAEAEWRFPGGAPEMIESFFALSLQPRHCRRVAPDIAGEMRLGKRVRAVVAALLTELGPHKEAVRRAMAWLLLPRQAALTARLMAGAGRWHLARGRRPVGRFRLVHQAGEPGRDLAADAAILAERYGLRQRDDAWPFSIGAWPGWAHRPVAATLQGCLCRLDRTALPASGALAAQRGGSTA